MTQLTYACMNAATTKADSSPISRPRRFETLVLLGWVLLTLYATDFLTHYLFLIHLYGFSRVRSEHLYFTAMPKGSPWIVSNGDRITEGHFLHFVVGLVLWLALFCVTCRFIFRLLPEKKDNDAA